MTAKLKTWLIVALFLGTAVYAIAEDITLTTYYPSPRGVYQELKTAGNMVVGNISNAPGARLHVIQDDPASAVPVFRADDETAPDTTPFIIASDGNVGIGGTPTPTQKLTVIGDARVEGTVSAQAFGSLSPLIFKIAGVERMRITDNGDIGIGTVTPAGKLDVAGTAALRGAAGQTGLVVNDAGQVGIGTATPDPSAVLDLSSTTKGFLPPGMTEAERDGIAAPAAGLVIYNTDASQLELYNGADWVPALAPTCPAGYVDAGNYCIEASERTPATWWSATEICQAAGAHLCSMIEWYPACTAGLPGLIGMTGNNEWIGDMTYHVQYHASILGSSGCATGTVVPPASTTFSFRCCTNKS